MNGESVNKRGAMPRETAQDSLCVQWRTQQELKELVKQDRPVKVLIVGMPRSGTMGTTTMLSI